MQYKIGEAHSSDRAAAGPHGAAAQAPCITSLTVPGLDTRTGHRSGGAHSSSLDHGRFGHVRSWSPAVGVCMGAKGAGTAAQQWS